MYLYVWWQVWLLLTCIAGQLGGSIWNGGRPTCGPPSLVSEVSDNQREVYELNLLEVIL